MGPVTVTAGAGYGEVLVRDGDRVERMFAVVAGNVTWVFRDGDVFRLEDASAGERRGQQMHGSLSSPMPATVASVKAATGDQLSRGETLIVLEEMKKQLKVGEQGDGGVTPVP